MPFSVPSLPYDYNALEPYIDEQTMHIHHDKHHQGYVDKLNAALEGHADLQQKSVEDLLRDIQSVPQEIRQAVINHGGGHANHSLFWTIMAPPGGKVDPASVSDISTATGKSWNSPQAFKDEFQKAAGSLFGSGWVWLVVKPNKTLAIESTHNQDSPLSGGTTPIMGIDVWEHAYYLKYQNKRADYIAAWWNVLNWPEINRRYKEAIK